MSRIFIVVFLIFGTFVGSGFSSGKEIMVFFSRFGVLSYLYIIIAGFLLFGLFYFFLTSKISEKIEKSKFLNTVIFFISLIFCASMFAGVENLFLFFPGWAQFLLIAALFLLCFIVTKRGMAGLEKANMFLMPVTAIIFLVVLVYSTGIFSGATIQTNSWAGFLYGILYVCLNMSMGGIVISKAGEGMTKKQAFWTSLLSCVLLVAFLLLGNFVLQQNLNTVDSDMPFLDIVSGSPVMFLLTYIIILVGCWTTLISLTLTIKSSFDKFLKNEVWSTFLAVFLPFCISVLGFSEIVSMLYPLCSVLGLFVLVYFLWSERGGGLK